jgi:hypothetical protein
MRVVSYLGGVPNLTKKSEKLEMLERFAEGVKRNGDEGITNTERKLLQADVGVIQGWVHADSPKTAHLQLRRNVANNIKNKHTIIIDSNLFLYAGNQHQYHRYSMDDVFPNTGNYFDSIVDPDRWKQISQDYNIALKDWHSRGSNIVVCLQRNGGWSMGGTGVVDWLRKTVKMIRRNSQRPIIIRPHPGDRRVNEYLPRVLQELNLQQSSYENIQDDFNRAHCVVTYNSSPGVAAAIEGIPVFVTDPFPERSQACAVANKKFSDLESPREFDRQAWIERLCMSHWNFDELSSGAAWTHIRKFCE